MPHPHSLQLPRTVLSLSRHASTAHETTASSTRMRNVKVERLASDEGEEIRIRNDERCERDEEQCAEHHLSRD